MKTIIIDDIKKNREMLLGLIADYCPQVEVIAQADSVTSGYELLQKQTPELLLLDVEMPDGTGFDLLEKLGDIPFEVVFVTAHDRYALQAIKFCALDYILKPVDARELIHAIHRATEKLQEQKSTSNFSHLLQNFRNKDLQLHKIAIPTQEGYVFVEVNNILRCEADGSYTSVILKRGKSIYATRKIKGFEDLLSDYQFFRVHRSFLINLNYIEKYHKGEGGYVVMSDGKSVDVSRRRKDAFLERLDAV